MKVTLWDLDWYHNTRSIPNINCMKVSSFHKQKGDEINFVTEVYHLGLEHDILYIFKDMEATPLPEKRFLDSIKTVLIGKGFTYYPHKKLSAVMAACRPDYLLYSTSERDPYANAHFVSFYADGQLIQKKQDYHNNKLHHRKTLVMDDYFWKAADEDIISSLEMLKEDKNVAFYEPISLKKILGNTRIRTKFLELSFSTGTIFKWRNDWGQDRESVTQIADFFKELKARTSSDLGFVPIRGLLPGEDEETGFLRCIEAVHILKRAKVKCKVVAPKESRMLRLLENWTTFNPTLSLVEHILHYECAISGVLWFDILNNPTKWKTPIFDLLIVLLADPTYSNYAEYAFTQWGYESLGKTKVRMDILSEHMNLLMKGKLFL